MATFSNIWSPFLVGNDTYAPTLVPEIFCGDGCNSFWFSHAPKVTGLLNCATKQILNGFGRRIVGDITDSPVISVGLICRTELASMPAISVAPESNAR